MYYLSKYIDFDAIETFHECVRRIRIIINMGKTSSKPLSMNQSLMQAVQIGDAKKLVELASKWPYLVHKPVNDNLLTPLMLACICEKIFIVILLIETYKVDINETDFNGFTALHHCAYKNTDMALEIALELCNRGANLQIKCMSGITALGIARSNRSEEFINLITYQQDYGKWARHPFNNRKKILWISIHTKFSVLPKGIIKELCLFY